jgi:hypothetical protein
VKRFDARRVKIHRSYQVDEAAKVLGSHKNTIRNWLGNGLEPIDERRPILIPGSKLRDYLQTRRRQSRSPCGPGQIYCLRCRTPKDPRSGTVDYIPITPTSGNLRGVCPDCLGPIYRTVSLSRLATVTGKLTISYALGQQRLVEGDVPSGNCNFDMEGDDGEL